MPDNRSLSLDVTDVATIACRAIYERYIMLSNWTLNLDHYSNTIVSVCNKIR